MADAKTELINSILSPAVELRDASYDLSQNYKEKLNGGASFEVPEIKSQIEDFRTLLVLISKEALECLSITRLGELYAAIDRVYRVLATLHSYKRLQDRTDHDQKQQFIQFFTDTSDAGRYAKSSALAWDKIIESITLLNYRMLVDSGSDLLMDTRKNLDDSKGVVDELSRLLANTKEEITKRGISKHARIFTIQADKHQRNTVIWGTVSTTLAIANAGLIYRLYCGVKDSLETAKIELGVLSVLLISLLSYVLVICVRNFFAEKHNQAINRHKANCLDSYGTFIDTASDPVKDAILQYVTQTIFAPFNPGYLNKDSVQSHLPLIEVLRATNPKKD